MCIRNGIGLVLSLGVLLACGGKAKGQEEPTGLSLSTHAITVTAAKRTAAPTATFTITLTGPHASEGNYPATFGGTRNNIYDVEITKLSYTTVTVLITFDTPDYLYAVGTHKDVITVFVRNGFPPYDQIANSPQSIDVTYIVTPREPMTIASMDPPSVEAGAPGFTLAASGTGFSSTCKLAWNGAPLETTYLSSTRLTARVTASDLVMVGPRAVTAYEPDDASVTSAPATFMIAAPSFCVTHVSPGPLTVNGPDGTLKVNGFHFLPASIVRWNGSPLATTYVSATQLTALLPADRITSEGTAQVTVVNPGDQGGISNACQVLINSPDAVDMRINPQHSGAIQFSSATLPAASLWSRTLEGPLSYPLIAQGKIYVTLPVQEGSQLVALDHKTGETVWGPVLLPGEANAVYDDGRIFVATSEDSLSGTVEAFEASTGAPLWSAVLPSGNAAQAPPCAAYGRVYFTASQYLFCLNGSTGAVLWSRYGSFSCSPAVTPEGAYVSSNGWTYKLDPATGAVLWIQDWLNGGGFGGRVSPIAANGLLFASDPSGFFAGSVLNPATGGLLGTYASDNSPAIGAEIGFFLQGGSLRCLRIGSNEVIWSFAGDGQLVSSPLLVNNFVFAGSSGGNLYGLDALTGVLLWTMPFDSPLPGVGYGLPWSGLAAGDGLLVIPAGNTLTAFQLAPAP